MQEAMDLNGQTKEIGKESREKEDLLKTEQEEAVSSIGTYTNFR